MKNLTQYITEFVNINNIKLKNNLPDNVEFGKILLLNNYNLIDIKDYEESKRDSYFALSLGNNIWIPLQWSGLKTEYDFALDSQCSYVKTRLPDTKSGLEITRYINKTASASEISNTIFDEINKFSKENKIECYLPSIDELKEIYKLLNKSSINIINDILQLDTNFAICSSSQSVSKITSYIQGLNFESLSALNSNVYDSLDKLECWCSVILINNG